MLLGLVLRIHGNYKTIGTQNLGHLQHCRASQPCFSFEAIHLIAMQIKI